MIMYTETLCRPHQGCLLTSTYCTCALSVSRQVLVALRLLRSGWVSGSPSVRATGYTSPLSRDASVEYLRPCVDMLQNLLNFQTTLMVEGALHRNTTILCGLPRVIGAVDGTLIQIKAPVDDEHLFVCRKGFHAMTVQVVVDSDLM